MSVLMRKLLSHQGVVMNAAGADGGDGGGGGSSTNPDPTKTGDQGGDGGTGDEGQGGDEGDDKGKKKPSDDAAKLLKEVMEKKGKIRDLEGTVEKLNGELKKFEGIDPEAVRALLRERQEQETKKLEQQGNWDALKKQMNDAHALELQAERTRAEQATQQASALQSQIADLTVGNSFGQSPFIRDEMALTPTKARIVYGSHFEFDGERVIGYDKPAGKKDRTPLVDAKGDPLPFDQALKKLVETDPDREHLLKGKMKPGAQSRTETTGGTPPAPTQELSARDKIRAGLQAGFRK